MATADVAEIIASNLRRVRRAKGLSLSELARISGIAKATISKLEVGQGNPTMATMFAIADALGAPLGELIADQQPTSHLVRRGEGATIWRGVVQSRYINRFQAGLDLVEIYEMNIDPERVEESQPHQEGVYEHVFVLEGPLLAGPSDELFDLETGDYVYFRADRPHRYIAKERHARALCLVHYPNAMHEFVMDGPFGISLEPAPRKGRSNS